MKRKVKTIQVLGLALMLLASCSTGPKPINYGSDQCSMCRMKIMDNRFGTEVVTKKGKAFKFDSEECLVDYLNTDVLKPAQIGMLLVSDYEKGGEFIEAKKAFYLHSENVPSPMGANISAYESRSEAEAMQQSKGGEVMDWNGIRRQRISR